MPLFTDIAPTSGLDFHHFNGMSGEMYLTEMTGLAAALFDYDGDGDLDVYLGQGTMLGPEATLADATCPIPEGFSTTKSPTDRLFRNDLGPDGPRFVDVSAKAGVDLEGWSMGATTGDFDNDGDVDLYVTQFGPNRLLRNRGDGTFEDIGKQAGVDDALWGLSAAFFDYDRDGWLDLYVANYVDFPNDRTITCYARSSRRDYCGPSGFEPHPDRLYRNRGDGTFEDVSAQSGIARLRGAGMGVVAVDFDDNGWLDLYVANDGMPNYLWLNQGDGTFLEEALFAGTAVNASGTPEASMGVDAGDFDDDGDFDLFMTHLLGETNTLFVNQGEGLFVDRSSDAGLAADSLPWTSFGTTWFDYDGDGRLDLVIANGSVKVLEEQREGDAYPLRQPNQLFRNLDGRRFVDTTASAGPSFTQLRVSRGIAQGDIDNDGDTDLLVTNSCGPVELLRNETGQNKPWLGLRLVDAHGRDALGAVLEVIQPGAAKLTRRVHTDGSYTVANDPRVQVGLGSMDYSVRRRGLPVRVRWPDGSAETFANVPFSRYSELRQGSGTSDAPNSPRAGTPDPDNGTTGADATDRQPETHR